MRKRSSDLAQRSRLEAKKAWLNLQVGRDPISLYPVGEEGLKLFEAV